MNKMLKIAFVIITILSAFTLSAFASENTIEWEYDYSSDGRETYYYGGELKLGSNKVSPLTDINKLDFITAYSDNVYYEFEVEQSGYYNVVTVTDFYYSTYISQDIRDGVAYGDEEYLTTDDNGYKVYLEEGECVFGLVFYFYDWEYSDIAYSSELNIEFIGEEITDLQIEEEYLEDIILGYHIDNEYDENNTSSILMKGRIIFDSEKEYKFCEHLSVEYSEDIAPGENDITFVLPNYRKEYTVQIKTVDDYIKNIEIGNIEEAAVIKETFLPDVVYWDCDDIIEFIITMPDGTKKTELEYYYLDIELKGEKYITVWCDCVQKDDGKWYFTVEAADKEFLCVPCQTIPASFDENLAVYWERVMEYVFVMIDKSSVYFSNAFDLYADFTVKERVKFVSNAFSAFGNCLVDVYELTELLVNYVI